MDDSKNVAILMAAGRGKRLGGDVPKQFCRVNDKMLMEYSLETFQNHPHIDEIVIVLPEEYLKMQEMLEYLKALRGEKGYTKIEHVGIRPTFDLCGMWGGYTAEGSKTVLPSKAYAKLSCRLVPNQDHEKIADLVKNYFEEPTSVQDITAAICPSGSALTHRPQNIRL